MRKRNATVVAVSALTALLTAGSAHAASVVELTTADVFVYQGFATSNFGAGTFAAPPWNLANILAAGKTTNGHSTETYLRFDLTGNPVLAAGETAKLRLYVRSSQTGDTSLIPTFGADPAPVNPISVDVNAVTSAWTESAVTWNTRTSIATAPAASFVVDGINKYVEVDVTDLVNAWIANPSSNLGLNLQGTRVVRNADDTTFVTAVFQASNQANPPQLVLNYIPEPMTASVAMGAAGLLLGRRRGR